ncbi:MAG: arylsulfotransferase family protein [Hyphomicrobiales bacterium]
MSRTHAAAGPRGARPGRPRAAASVAALAAAALVSLLAIPRATSAATDAMPYRSPVDGARYVRPGAGLIVRPGGRIAAASVRAADAFTVVGSQSGPHAGRAFLSDDGLALLWRGDEPFRRGEAVSWTLEPGARFESGGSIPPASGTFHVAGPDPALPPPAERLRSELAEEMEPRGGGALAPALPWDPLAAGFTRAARADTLPPDFPAIYRTVDGTTSPGRIFLADISFSDFTLPSYLMILEDDGTPVFYRRLTGWGLDFKMQQDGRLTYFDQDAHAFYALDSTYAVVDSFMTGNGYVTDVHELRVLPGDHALLMAYDYEPVDMSAVVEDGDSAAVVIGLIVQEIDRDKNVVFEWRSWDHFAITDAEHVDLTAPIVDAVHGNAIEVDTDGNLLLSSRHLSEITKIDRATGDIVWRLGGKHNEFTFTNDPEGFSYQHAIRRITNGDITLFDNGNYHVPPHSRALEYRLDEAGRQATLVWQYRNEPDIMAYAMGYVQRFGDGNTLIGWGSANPTVTEVDSTGAKATELTFDPGLVSYRAYRFPWYPERAAANATLAAAFLPPRSHPFRKDGALTVSVRRGTDVTVRMYDVRGRLVRVLLDHARLDPGNHDVPIDGADLASGLYFCRVRAEGRSDTRTIVLVR